MKKCESVKEKCESEKKNNSIFALKVLFLENNEKDKTLYIAKDNSECEVLNKILIIAVLKCVVTFAETKFCSKE